LFEYQNTIVCLVPAIDLLRPRLRDELEKELFESACVGFNRPQTEAFREDVASHLREGTLYVAMNEGVAVGFAVMKDIEKMTYIAGIVKKPEAPSGIVERIVENHIQTHRCEVVTVRTQNDRVVDIVKHLCSEVVPISREAANCDLSNLQKMGLLSSKVTSDLVVHGHYGTSPMIGGGERRRSRDPAVVATTNRIDYDHGDALLLVGYVDDVK
jgi:hypothetical protein